MAGSFEVFRKYQRSLLVAVAILAMLAFFVLPPFLQSGADASSQDPVAVAWKGGSLRESELERAVAMQAAVNRFILQSAAAAGRDPSRITLFPENEEAVVRSLMLAKEARENGVVVSDRAVNDYLSQLTNDMVRPEQLDSIIAGLRIGPVGVSQADLFSALRTERAAWASLIMGQAAFSGDPPGWRWEAFRQLEQSAVVEVVPVDVRGLAADVPPPTESELRAFFERFKERLPEPESREPGFREPHRIEAEYLVANRKQVEELVKGEVTDEAIAAYYDKNKEKLFRASKQEEPAKEQSETEGARIEQEVKRVDTDDAEKVAGPDDKAQAAAQDEADKPTAKDEAKESPAAIEGFEPLEKVKERIREELVRERVEKRIDAVFTAAAADVTGYSEDLAVWRARNDGKAAEPRRPDVEAIAKVQGLQSGTTGLVSARDAAQLDGIGRSFEFTPDPGSRFGVRQQSWLEMMFGRSSILLRPATSRDIDGNRYLSWKFEDRSEFTPTFDDAKQNVEKAWRIVEARGLARKKAAEIGKKAEAEKATLEAVVAGRNDVKATQVGPFTFLTQGSAPLGAPAELSRPKGLDLPGEAFMKAVFALEPGGTAVVFNEPETVCYCVRLVSYEPSAEELRQRFLDDREDQSRLAMVSQRQYQRRFGEWVESLDKKYAVDWKRPPRIARDE